MKSRLVFAVVFSLVLSVADGYGQTRELTDNKVWVVYFTSRDCGECASAGKLLAALKNRNEIAVKTFFVERPGDRKLLRDIEKIHSESKLSVPVVLVGDSILTGSEIAQKLEETVSRLTKRGGAPPPYLGPNRAVQPVRAAGEEKCNCGKGKPPEITDELHKIKNFLNSWF